MSWGELSGSLQFDLHPSWKRLPFYLGLGIILANRFDHQTLIEILGLRNLAAAVHSWNGARPNKKLKNLKSFIW